MTKCLISCSLPLNEKKKKDENLNDGPHESTKLCNVHQETTDVNKKSFHDCKVSLFIFFFSMISSLLIGKMYVFVLVQLSNMLKANKIYV